MTKIISKPSATFKGWLMTYLNHSLTEAFLAKHTHVSSIEQIKTELITMTCDIEHIRNTVKLTTKNNHRWLKLVNQKIFLINTFKDVLDDALIDDLIINNGQKKPHVMNHDDLLELREKLIKYLQNGLSTVYKINWLLQHKTISDKTLGRKIMLNPDEINDYKSREIDVGKMKLESATECAKYYDGMVQKQLMKS